MNFLYIKDIGINRNNKYILHNNANDGLLNNVNASFNVLDSRRITQYKIFIITRYSIGTEIKNTKTTFDNSNIINSTLA